MIFGVPYLLLLIIVTFNLTAYIFTDSIWFLWGCIIMIICVFFMNKKSEYFRGIFANFIYTAKEGEYLENDNKIRLAAIDIYSFKFLKILTAYEKRKTIRSEALRHSFNYSKKNFSILLKYPTLILLNIVPLISLCFLIFIANSFIQNQTLWIISVILIIVLTVIMMVKFFTIFSQRYCEITQFDNAKLSNHSKKSLILITSSYLKLKLFRFLSILIHSNHLTLTKISYIIVTVILLPVIFLDRNIKNTLDKIVESNQSNIIKIAKFWSSYIEILWFGVIAIILFSFVLGFAFDFDIKSLSRWFLICFLFIIFGILNPLLLMFSIDIINEEQERV